MPDGLAVAAHQLGQAQGVAGLGGGGLGLRDRFCQLQQGCGTAGLALADGHQLLAQLVGVGEAGAVEDAPLGTVGWSRELGEHRVDAVGAGAAHQPQHPHGGGVQLRR